MMKGSNRRKFVGMALVAPSVLGGVWTIRRLMASSNGALAHEGPEGSEHEKVTEALKKTAHRSGFEPGAMSEPMEQAEEITGTDEAKSRVREVKETAAGSVGQIKEQAKGTAEGVARQAREAAYAAKDSAVTAAPGMLSWMRRNIKMVIGLATGAITLIGLMRWRRGRKADLSDAGESVVERISDIKKHKKAA